MFAFTTDRPEQARSARGKWTALALALAEVRLAFFLGLALRFRLALLLQLLLPRFTLPTLAFGLLLLAAFRLLPCLERDVRGARVGFLDDGLGRLRRRFWWFRGRSGLGLGTRLRRRHDRLRGCVQFGGHGFRFAVLPRHREHQHADEQQVHEDGQYERRPFAAHPPRGRRAIGRGDERCHHAAGGRASKPTRLTPLRCKTSRMSSTSW
jgi:hypothetical protein